MEEKKMYLHFFLKEGKSKRIKLIIGEKKMRLTRRFRNITNNQETQIHAEECKLPLKKFTVNLEENKKAIQEGLNNTKDLTTREIMTQEKKVMLIYLTPLVDNALLQSALEHFIEKASLDLISTVHEYKDENELNSVINHLLMGNCIVAIEGLSHVIVFEYVKLSNFRSPDEPKNEKVIRGPHDGFIESLDTNLYLLRHRIKNRNLYIDYMTIGKESNTTCAVVYLHHLADRDVLTMVQERLKTITVDRILDLGHLEEFLEDSPYSPFPQILTSERPDRIVANLLDGKIAILLEGAPEAIIVPATFFSFFQSPDDYSSRWLMGTFYRSLRLVSLFIAVFLPAIYVSIVTFHSEVIPRGLVLIFKGAVEDIPYPPIIEALFIEITLELLREAGIRLPNPIGQTIGIVGGLVIGDAVVRAGLISNFMIIVVALTAIASFVVPIHEMSASIRLIRFPLMLAAAAFGLIGIMYGLMFLLIHLCRLHSFGKPYFYPLAPTEIKDLKDTFIRLPLWKLYKKSKDTHSSN